MKTAKHKAKQAIPPSISAYIRKYFGKEILTDIRPITTHPGKIQYQVRVVEDNLLYDLSFNEKGLLTEKKTEPVFEMYEDYYEMVPE